MAQQSTGTLKQKISRQYHNLTDSSFNHVTDNFVGTCTTHTNTTDAANPGTLTIPAGRLNVGTVIKVTSFGVVTDNNSTDTLTNLLNSTHGSTRVALATGAALDVADDDIVQADSEIYILTTGTAGTFAAISKIWTNTGDTVVRNWLGSTAIDTTVATTIAHNADWSVAHAENIFTQLVHTAQVFG